MSNDLISRSALLEEINNFSMRITGSANAEAITIMEETKKSIAKMVDEQPTAYDVDKVVERLEVNSMYADEEVGAVVMLDNAVELVKFGGIIG